MAVPVLSLFRRRLIGKGSEEQYKMMLKEHTAIITHVLILYKLKIKYISIYLSIDLLFA